MRGSGSRITGKLCVVTGANRGIGKAIAFKLAILGAKIILICRNKSMGESVQSWISKETNNKSIDLMIVDLSSQDSILNFVNEYNSRYSHLDILINNAAVLMGKRVISTDGIEMTFAVNHLAYFLLTISLLDSLKRSESSRIINISSDGHIRSNLDLTDLQFEQRSFNSFKAYYQSKLANIMFTYSLDRMLRKDRVRNVSVNALHPGRV
ncbi:MAG: SDR family NAD(P)-dependent oxidoreductase [Candidatus Hodarchaeota archaeon]